MTHLKKIFALALLITLTTKAYSRARIPFGKKEVITVVKELPDNENYVATEGAADYLDLATIHEEFNIAWFIPLWITKDAKLVLYDQNSDIYYEAETAEMQSILAENNIVEGDILKVPFYNRYGGKLVAVLLIVLIGWFYLSGDDED